MPEDNDRKLFDKRVAHRYVRKGLLDEKEYERHLKALPDLTDQAVPIESDLDADELDESEEAPPAVAVAPPPAPSPAESVPPAPDGGAPPIGEPPSEG